MEQQQDPSVAAVAVPGAASLYGLQVLAENVQISEANKTRFYVLARQPLEEEGLTRAVFTAACRADRIDDIILALRGAGLELVALHDRPEGSELGRYHYVLEAENQEGISQEVISSLCEAEGLRFAGCFQAKEKGLSAASSPIP